MSSSPSVSSVRWSPPDCWSDDARMNSLMSPFRNKDVNPLDWEKKMSFWTELIESTCEQLGDPIFTLAQLKEKFRRKGVLPAGLSTVLGNMRSTHQCQTFDSYSAQSQSWISWGFTTLVKNPISWLFGWNQISSDSEELILPELVKRMAASVLQRHWDTIDSANALVDVSQLNVIDFSALKKLVKDICSTDRALELVLCQLQKENEVTVTTVDNQHKIIKFRDRSASVKTSSSPNITEVDTGLVRLQKTQQNLERLIESKEQEAEKYEDQARLLLRQGQKAKAKTILKKKIMLTKEIEKTATSLENIHSLVYQLQNSKSQKQIVDAYKAGVSAFKQNLDTSGLTADRIDETIDEMHEVFSDQEDIAHAISSAPWASSSRMAESDAALEDELNTLLAESVEADIIRLPTVPSDGLHYPTKESTEDSSNDRLQRLKVQLAE